MAKKIQTVGEGTFAEVVADSDPEIQKIAKSLRALIADVMPGVTEVPWVRQRTVGYGVGPKKMSEHFCYLAPQKQHVNLGFFYGADLEDPAGILEGSGKLLRHVKVKDNAAAKQPELQALLERASQHLPKLG